MLWKSKRNIFLIVITSCIGLAIMFCVNAIAPFKMSTSVLILMGLTFVFLWSGFLWARWTLIILFVVFGLSWLFIAPFNLPKEAIVVPERIVGSYYVAVAYLGGGFLYLCLATFLKFSEFITDIIEKKKVNKILPEDWKGFLEPVKVVEKSDSGNLILTVSQEVEKSNKTPKVIPRIKKRRLSRNIYVIALSICIVAAFFVILLLILTSESLISDVQNLPRTTRNTITSLSLESQSFLDRLSVTLLGGAILSFAAALSMLFITLILCIIPILLYGCFFLLPFLLLLPVTLPISFFWRQPSRFLLLRPFHRQRITQSLKKIIRNSVSPYGHSYTLADTDLKIPWYIRIPMFLGSISIFSHRLKKISLPHHIIRTIKAIRRKRLRTMNWCFSPSKVFPLTCTNFSWQACVSRISQEMDIIIIDLSGIKEGVIWELEHCHRLGLINRVVFLVNDKERTQALANIEKYVGNISIKDKLFTYNKQGLLNSEGFELSIFQNLIETGKRAVPEMPLGTIGNYRKKFWSNIVMEFLTAVAIFLLIGLLWPITNKIELPNIKLPRDLAEIVKHKLSPDTILVSNSKEDINKATFSPTGKLIATVTESGEVEFWENSTAKQCPFKIPKEYSIDNMCFSPDEKYLITSGAFVPNLLLSWPDSITLSLWRIYPLTIKLIKSVTFKLRLSNFEEIAYDNDGKLLVARSNNNLYLFNANLLSLISISNENISDFSLYPDSSLLISTYHNKMIKIQKIRNQLIETDPLAVYTYDASEFALSPDGKTLASFSIPIRLRIIGEMDSSEILAVPDDGYFPWMVEDICFSPDNRSLAITTAYRTQVINLASKTRIELLHEERIQSICFDPSNPQKLIAGSVNGKILVWNLIH